MGVKRQLFFIEEFQLMQNERGKQKITIITPQ